MKFFYDHYKLPNCFLCGNKSGKGTQTFSALKLLQFISLFFCIATEGFFVFLKEKRITYKYVIVAFTMGTIIYFMSYIIEHKAGKKGSAAPVNRGFPLLFAGILLWELFSAGLIYSHTPHIMAVIYSLHFSGLLLFFIGAAVLIGSQIKFHGFPFVYLTCLALLFLCCTILYTAYDMNAAPYGLEPLKHMIGVAIPVLILFLWHMLLVLFKGAELKR